MIFISPKYVVSLAFNEHTTNVVATTKLNFFVIYFPYFIFYNFKLLEITINFFLNLICNILKYIMTLKKNYTPCKFGVNAFVLTFTICPISKFCASFSLITTSTICCPIATIATFITSIFVIFKSSPSKLNF